MANRNKADLTVRLLGTLIGCVGVLTLLSMGLLLAKGFYEWNGWLELLVLTYMFVVPTAFGLMCIMTAFGAWRSLTVKAIRRVTAMLAWLFFLLVWSGIAQLLPERMAEPSQLLMTAGLFIAALTAGVFHEAVSRRLVMRSSAAPAEPPHISKVTIGLICFVLWGLGIAVTETVIPRRVSGHVSSFTPLLQLVGPVVVAVLAYKITIHYAHGLPGLPLVGPTWHRMRRTRLGEVHRERVAKFQCPACAYDVRQTLADHKTYCPECGFDLASVAYPKPPAEIA